MGCDIIVIDMHAGFQEKLCFDKWDAVYIFVVMNEIVVLIWFMLFEDLGSMKSKAWKKYVYMFCIMQILLLCDVYMSYKV